MDPPFRWLLPVLELVVVLDERRVIVRRVLPPLREGFAADAVVLVRLLLVPVMPCTLLRCAPSEAARVKVLPHSGQVSAVEFPVAPAGLSAFDLRALAILGLLTGSRLYSPS